MKFCGPGGIRTRDLFSAIEVRTRLAWLFLSQKDMHFRHFMHVMQVIAPKFTHANSLTLFLGLFRIRFDDHRSAFFV